MTKAEPPPPFSGWTDTLKLWLPAQRWFASKDEALADLRLLDRALLQGDARAWWLVEATTAGGATVLYQLPVLERMDAAGQPHMVDWDGLVQPEGRRCWLELLSTAARRRSAHGELVFEPCLPLENAARAANSRLVGAEQTNTSVLYQDEAGVARWVLKLFRRLQPGENPDFEIPHALSLHTGFRNVPAAAGRVRYRSADGACFTLATLHAYIPNRGDGWSYVLERLRAGLVPDEELGQLARRTAELHLALAAIPTPDFASEPITAADGERWRQRALTAALAPRLAAYAPQLAPWRARLQPGAAIPCDGCAKIRIHGDYHLGQVLRTESDFYIFDFEGEPARPLADRRQRGCVLQDVAGMLRSFAYAAHAAARPDWEAPARRLFLDRYRATLEPARAAGLALVPGREADFQAALRFFECEKAVYELGYELAHRPDWVAIPLAGLDRLLAYGGSEAP